MEAYLSDFFEDIRYEGSSTLFLSLPDADILRQSKFTDHEFDIFKDIALEKLH